MRAAARAVTGCTLSTPVHTFKAGAGLMPVSVRWTTSVAKFLAKACALSVANSLRVVAGADSPPSQTEACHGRWWSEAWWTVGREAWQPAGIALRVEPLLHDL